MNTENLVSISQYAKLCGGLTSQAIHSRRKNKTISFIKKKYKNDFIFLIDAEKFPPAKWKAGRPAYNSKSA